MENPKVNCILLVDDDNITNYINQRLLKKLQLTDNIVVANNGREGLDYINNYCQEHNSCAPELIFIDMNMPGLKGPEFIEEYKKIPNKNKDKVKIFVISASAKEISKEKIKGHDNNIPCLTKPLTLESLKQVLDIA